MLNYESITVQVTNAGTGCTITYETSCDSVTWVKVLGIFDELRQFNSSFTSTTVGQFQFSRRGCILEQESAPTVQVQYQL